jgi:hypothetical protein
LRGRLEKLMLCSEDFKSCFILSSIFMNRPLQIACWLIISAWWPGDLSHVLQAFFCWLVFTWSKFSAHCWCLLHGFILLFMASRPHAIRFLHVFAWWSLGMHGFYVLQLIGGPEGFALCYT